MKKVIYSREGESVSDFDAERFAYALLEQDQIHTSNESVINWVRVLICEGAVDCKDVEFVFINPWTNQSEIIVADKKGRLNRYPSGFCDENIRAIERLLKHG